MQAFSASRTDYSRLVNLLAEYFQIRDDFLNISSSTYVCLRSTVYGLRV